MLKRSYSQPALERWLNRLAMDWEQAFSREELKAGRDLYRAEEVRAVDLQDDLAIIYIKHDREESYTLVEWEADESFSVRSSLTDRKSGRSLAVAGLYEIEELVGEEALGLPAESEPEAEEKGAEASTHERGPAVNAEEVQKARLLRVVLTATGQGVALSAFWEKDGQRRNAFAEDEAAHGNGNGNGNGHGTLNRHERELLIRLTSWARQRNFVYQHARGQFHLAEAARVVAFLNEDLPRWRRHFEVDEDPDLKAYARGIQTVSGRVKAERREDGSLGVDCSLGSNGTRFTRRESLSLIARGGEAVLLPGRGIYRLETEQADLLADWTQALGGDLEGELPPYMLLSIFSQERLPVSLSPELKQWRRQLTRPPSQNGDLPELLRPYQRRGVGWLQQLGERGCHPLLADEMGLGKTLQVLSLLHATRGDFAADCPHLVVCPASVIPVWQRECARFFPHFRVEVLASGNDFAPREGEPVIWLASYTQLRRRRSGLEGLEFGYAVLDEGQFIKNPNAKVTQACQAIRARRRLVLTGTPLENRVEDVWAIFQFLMPGLLGSRRRMTDALARDPEPTRKRLRRQIEPFILRRLKRDVLDELPEKVEIPLACPMTQLQQGEYNRLLEEGRRDFGGDLQNTVREQAIPFFALLTRLRQTSCDPGLLPWLNTSIEQSGKYRVLVEKLDEVFAAGKKAVLFSQFVQFLRRVKTASGRAFPGIPRYELTGQTKDRGRPVESFQNAEGPAAMFVSLKAGGTGITLHAADYVFLLDPWWNPAVEAQAIDRVHRMGRRDDVFVYRLFSEDTIEERVEALKAEKGALFDELFGGLEGNPPLEKVFRSLDDLAGRKS